MERLDVPEFLRRDHHFSDRFDVAPFLVDLDSSEPFREAIGQFELWRDDDLSGLQIVRKDQQRSLT